MTTPSLQKQIMDKIKYYRDESFLCDARNQHDKAYMYIGRAAGLEEAYKMFISEKAGN